MCVLCFWNVNEIFIRFLVIKACNEYVFFFLVKAMNMCYYVFGFGIASSREINTEEKISKAVKILSINGF